MDMLTLMDKYNCDEKCRELLENLRWPAGSTCLRCGLIGVPELPDGGVYQCASCRYQFSVTAGTIMHDTHLPLLEVVPRHLPDLGLEEGNLGQPDEEDAPHRLLPDRLVPLPPHPRGHGQRPSMRPDAARRRGSGRDDGRQQGAGQGRKASHANKFTSRAPSSGAVRSASSAWTMTRADGGAVR